MGLSKSAKGLGVQELAAQKQQQKRQQKQKQQQTTQNSSKTAQAAAKNGKRYKHFGKSKAARVGVQRTATGAAKRPEGGGPTPRKSEGQDGLGPPTGGAQKGGLLKGRERAQSQKEGRGLRRVAPRKVGGRKIRAFFSLLPPEMSLFVLSLGVFSWNLGGV